ncbi:MAG: hypothetical protein ACI9KD_003016, partial [Congregibacter sp.]
EQGNRIPNIDAIHLQSFWEGVMASTETATLTVRVDSGLKKH